MLNEYSGFTVEKQERELFLSPLIVDDLLQILGGRPCGYIEIGFENGREPSLFPLLHHCVNLPQHRRENKCLDPVCVLGSPLLESTAHFFGSQCSNKMECFCFS